MRHPRARYQRVAEAIERYLLAHPEAADSDRGIADWWLPEMGFAATVDEVQKALELLCERGTVMSQTLMDGRVIYRAGRNASGTTN